MCCASPTHACSQQHMTPLVFLYLTCFNCDFIWEVMKGVSFFFTESVLWGMQFLGVLTIISAFFLTISFTLSNPSKAEKYVV